MFQLAHVQQEGGLGDAAAAAKVLSKYIGKREGDNLGEALYIKRLLSKKHCTLQFYIFFSSNMKGWN